MHMTLTTTTHHASSSSMTTAKLAKATKAALLQAGIDYLSNTCIN